MLMLPAPMEDTNSSFVLPDQTCQRLTLQDIQLATIYFDEALVIGRGGFGNVYKSLSKFGSVNEVAIKRLHSTSSQGANEFEAEVKLLSKLRHGNLVPLIGYCSEGKEMVLAYEFMPNGTLEDHLHKGDTELSWLERLNICIGAARGLHYLHTGTSTQHGVIHRDVKSSNILLDSNFDAKISDFGLAKVGTINQTRSHVSTLVKGTFGYMDPCYFYSGKLTRKSDVYAFGVVLFEVLSGKRAVDPTLDEEQWSLAIWAQDHFKAGRLNDIINDKLMGQVSKKALKEFTSIAVQCLHIQPKQRPTMAEVVVKLESVLSKEREIVGSGVHNGKFFDKVRYFLTGKADLMPAHADGSEFRTSTQHIQKSNNKTIRAFTYAELVSATKHCNDEEFSTNSLETIYKGWVDELTYAPTEPGFGLAMYVRTRHIGTPMLDLTPEEFYHPNLVNLLGYYLNEHKLSCVYELTPSLDKLLFGENQAENETQATRFTWVIKHFSRQYGKKLYSDVFVVGGYKWRVLIFPKGNNNLKHLSMYLDVADFATLPYKWSRYTFFSLSVVNQIRNKFTVKKASQHKFHGRKSDWGFTTFMPLSELYDPSKGYIVNDTCVIEADVVVRKVIDYWAYGSKKETGYVGLKNQGATCYMNSLLQTLYHIPYFRKAVYHMPTTETDMPSGSIPLALQSLFYKLQYNETSVETKELTESFWWNTYVSFLQHDVQELNRVLWEKLEDKMKGTVVEGTIQKLFEGHHMNYLVSINADVKSTRKESFYDLQLDVKGCKDVYASFDKYVEVERLEGDNKYHAEGHGLQDARKGVLFTDFPPVLELQLKRFEYDYTRDTMVKINDRYEFPLELDLDREGGKYLSPDADKSVRNLYTLHSVLVHSGGISGGHYYAFIRPTLSDQWFKFDDESVTKEDIKKALEDQYGGEEELPQTNPGYNNAPFKFTKYSNAYMLVYIRESDKEKIVCDVNENDIAEHLRIRLKREKEEKETKKRYKAEAHLYTIIKVAREVDLLQQIGKDLYFGLVDHEKVHSFRIQKLMTFNCFKEEVAIEFGIPVQFQRYWLWAKRPNQTYRPNRPLTPDEEALSVGQLKDVSSKIQNAELKLFLETEFGPDLNPLPPPEKAKDEILLFFKLYDPEKLELRFVGRSFVNSLGKVIEIIPKLKEMAGFNADEEIQLYEEIRIEPNVMCEHLDKGASFRSCEIEDGDIICFQKLQQTQVEKYQYPDVPSFFNYVNNRQIVHFRSLDRPKEDDFSLELSKSNTYDDVVERVAYKLGLDDPSKIRLTPHNYYSQQPILNPIKYRVADLLDMLVHNNQMSDILYYEVLDIPLPELQGLKTLKIVFLQASKEEPVIHNIRLPKQSTVGDVLDELKTKVELSHRDAELRLIEVFVHKIYKIFPLNEKIENINDQYWTLRAEEIPEEEKNLGPQDRLIHVYHFNKETNHMQVQNFGDPFFLVIYEDETLADVKARIQKKLQVSDDEFSKWKFAFLSLGRTEYLQDTDIVSSLFQKKDVYGAWDLGLEHPDTLSQ